MADLNVAVILSGRDTGAGAAVSAVEKSLRALEGAASAPVKAIGALTSGLGAIGLAAGGLKAIADGVGGVASGMVAGNAQMETYETQLKTLLGSADAARERLQKLQKFGQETPFDLPEVVRAEKVLLGFGLTGERVFKQTGLNADQFRTLVGDVAAGTGAQFEEIALNFGKFSSGATGEAIARFQEMGIVTREQLSAMGVQFSKAGELISPLPQAMEAAVKIAQQKFGGGMQALSQTFDGQMSNLRDAFGQAKNVLAAPIFDALKQGLVATNQVLSSEGFQNGLQNLAQLIGTGVKGALNLGAQAFHALVDAATQAKDAAGAALDWLQSKLAAAGAAFAGMAAQVGPAGTLIGDALSGLTGIAQAAALALQGNFGGALDTVRGALGNFAPIIDTVVDAFQRIRPVVEAVASFIGNNLTPILATIGAVVTAVVIPALVDMAATAAATLGGLAVAFAVANAPLIALGAAVFLLAKAWSENWGDIQGKTQATWAFIQPILSAIVDALGRFATEAAPLVVAAWDTITGKIGQAIAFIGPYVQAGLAAVVGFFTAHGDQLKAIVQGAWTVVTSIVQAAWAVLSGVLIAGLEALNGNWAAAWERLKVGAAEALQALAPIALSVLPALGNAALQLGTAIWQGLVNAINAGAAQVGGAIHALAQNAINSAKSALGVASPSKVFEDIGQDTVQGFTDGIEAASDDAVQAVTNTMDDVAQAAGDAADTITQAATSSFDQLVAATGSRFERMFSIVEKAQVDIDNAQDAEIRAFHRNQDLEEKKFQRKQEDDAAAYQDRLLDLQQAAATKKGKAHEAALKAIAEFQENHQTQLENLATQHARNLEDIQQRHDDRMDELALDAADKMRDAQDKQALQSGAALTGFLSSLDALDRDTQAKAQAIGDHLSQALQDAADQAGKATQDAIDRANNQILEATDNLNLSRQIRGQRSEFQSGLDAESLQHQRDREDADNQYKLARDLAKAKTDEEKKQIQERYNEAQEDLKRRRKLDDDDRKFREDQAKKLQQFNDTLENDALSRQIQRIKDERDSRIREIGTALADKQRQLQKQADDERDLLLKSYKQRVQDLEDEFVKKLGPLTAEAQTALSAFLDDIATRTSNVTAAAMAAAAAVANIRPPSSGGGGGGGGSSSAATVPIGQPGTSTSAPNQTPAQQSFTNAFLNQQAANIAAGFKPRFASGGSFDVGGTGGTDTSLVAFMATPGEHVTVWPPGQPRGGGEMSEATMRQLAGYIAEAVAQLNLSVNVRDVQSGLLRLQRSNGSLGFK